MLLLLPMQSFYSQWISLIGFNWTTWFVLASCAVLAWICWRNSRYVRLINAVPGPKGIPILGNLLELNVGQVEFLRIVHREWVEKHGPIYRGWAGSRSIVCISSPELMEPILASQKLITKGKEYSYLSRWLGACMFLTTGLRWRSRRRLLTPAFHFQILESFFDVFNDQSHQLIKELDAAAAARPAASVDGSVNVYKILTQCALDIICDSSMGRQVRKREETSGYLHSINRITQIVMERSLRPWLDSDLLFNLSALGRENQRCVKILHDFTNQVIQDRKQMLNNNQSDDSVDHVKSQEESPKRRLAFLDLLIQASENGDKLSDDDIREEVDTFMFAGHDTTATAMSWFLYCIARNPEEQKLLFDEVDEVFEDSDRPCTPQDAANLKYLDCCIKETLRMYPSIPGVMRTITEDTEIGGFVLPAGLSVALLIYGMHRNPKVYPEPDTFKPERFLPEQSANRHPYAFIPFSAGPRNCIGQKYAQFELKVVLSWVLRKFEFSLADPSCPAVSASSEIVLKPVDGIHLSVKPRQPNRSAIAA
ncbi:cytochrome P450 4C1-like [Daphnia pulicaria]|uniref:cytochrome P450 4C1-like n=1 Tax=Daphnia pulicaria TaxID=35523 RepID=UPI001EEB2663|nr:cytochrome P450 4C1-like [Daphnia pulicaria]